MAEFTTEYQPIQMKGLTLFIFEGKKFFFSGVLFIPPGIDARRFQKFLPGTQKRQVNQIHGSIQLSRRTEQDDPVFYRHVSEIKTSAFEQAAEKDKVEGI
ncbi:MAG: hypothetical protein KKH02_00440 [Proteobacteria bacterium]|nr:hypothetical protein [Pseudomonadota bacterium]